MNKKNEQAFTLAELLAVITILGVIALIVFPAVNKAIKNSKEKSYNQQVESILNSAENWTLENMSSLSDTNDNYITIGELQQSGYLEAKRVINPITDEEMNGCIVIKYDKNYNQYTYQYKDESCSDVQAVPIITLNGDVEITIEKGETFTDPGYTATYKGVDITSNVQASGSVNTAVVDTYTLTYTVSYNGKDALPVERVVNVICPTVTIMGKSIQTCETETLDPDGNLRYVGPTPNNYVSFNGELWRIIGVFNGQAKIISNDYYSTSIMWDDDSDGSTSNNWATASLQLELNNTTDGYITTIQTNDPTSYDYIDLEHVWKIGGYDSTYVTTGTRSAFYTAERSATPAGAEGSEATWKGAIGLMYPSDYGYSTNGDLEICDEVIMYDWFTEQAAFAECAENSWLYDSNKHQWTLTPLSDNSYFAFRVSFDGFVDNYQVFLNRAVRPVLYLKSNVKIVGGLGTDQQPFILAQ